MISASASSTTLRVLEKGALKTATPRSVAAARSIWFVPMQNAPSARSAPPRGGGGGGGGGEAAPPPRGRPRRVVWVRADATPPGRAPPPPRLEHLLRDVRARAQTEHLHAVQPRDQLVLVEGEADLLDV